MTIQSPIHQPGTLTVPCQRSGAMLRAERIASSMQRPPAEPGDTCLVLLHLRPLPGALFIDPRAMRPAEDLLLLSLPKAALEAEGVGALRCPGGKVDAIALGLGASLLPALRPGGAPLLFAGHVVQALLTHIVQHYGEMRPARGGLSPRQERIAKEMLLASIRDESAATDIPQAIGLSRAHFIRAFRDSAGQTPHRWLTARKIDAAKRLLAEDDLPLTDIALACGFSDQSHFTRVFSRHAGTPPGIWRRSRRLG